MLKKTVRCEDFDGNPYEKDCYFNLTKAELIELEMSLNGTLTQLFEKIVQENNGARIMEYFKKILLLSYGEKSLDGKKFDKSKEVLDDFVSSPAYSEIFTELCTNAEAASAFVNGIMPKDMQQEVKQAVTETKPVTETVALGQIEETVPQN